MKEYEVLVTAKLDTSQVKKELENLDGKEIKLDVKTGNTAKEVQNVNKQIVNTRKSTQSFGDTLKKSLNIGAAASLTAEAFGAIRTAADKATDAIKDIDGAVTDLRMATNGSYGDTLKLVQGYNMLGQRIGAITTEVSDSADAWLRQGHSISETNTLIKDSMILSKVAKLDSADSTEYLTSAMKGYKVEVENVIGIVDKLTAVDLVSATDAGGLAEAMSRTAVSAHNADIEMEKLLGYLAVTGEVTQKSMSSIGEGFKTIFTRMADIKAGKLELVDEDGTVESLSDVETVLNNMGIKLRESNNEFRDFGDVLDEVAAAWGSYSSVQQAAISKAFAGTRQSENFKVLMENYSSAISYMETAMNSAGTAEQKFGAYLDSIEAKTKSLQAAFEALAVNTFSTELFGGIIEATTSLVTFLDKTNLLKSSLAGIAGAGAIKVFTMLASGIANAAVRMNEFNSALSILKSGNIGESQMQKLIQLTSNLSDSQLQAVVSSKALSTEQRMAILTANGMSTAEAQATLATMGLATAEGTATSATFSLSGALKGLWATLKANPLILVASAITAAVTAFSAFSDAAEEAAQRAEENFNKLTEAAQAATETRKSVGSLIEQYKELADASDGSWSTEEANELKGIQEQITSLVGDQAGNLDLVNGKIDEEYQKLLSIYNLLSDDELASAESAYNVSQEKFEKGYVHPGKSWTNSYSGEKDDLAAWYIMRAYEQVLNPVEGANGGKWFAQKYLGWDEDTNGYAGNLGQALEQIGSYEDGLVALKEWRDILNTAEDADYFGDSFGNPYEFGDALSYVNTKIKEFEAVIAEAEAAKNRFFSAKANDEVLDFLVENDLNTQDDFDSWINSVMSNADYSNDYKQALINAMQGYLPHFEIPDSVKKSLIANMDGLMDELTDHFTSDEDRNILSDWLMNMDPSEYQTFVNWWKENANSEVVTGSLDSMMTAFANHLERVSIAANGIATEVSGITSAAQKELINTQAVIDGISSAQGILSEQSTGVSLSVEDFNSEELKEYTSALEYNNGALQLNADKVNELVKANAEAQISLNDTNKAVAQSKYLENAAEIEKLRKQLDGLSDDETAAQATIQSNIDTLLAENSTLKNVCTQYDLMSASLREATSAYQHWLNAQGAAQSGDMFDDTLSAMNHINDTLNNKDSELYGRVGRTDYEAAVDLIIPESIDSSDKEAVNNYMDSIYSLFTYDDDGNRAGLNIDNFCKQAVDEGLMYIDEASGSYQIAGQKTMEDFAEGMNLSLPLVQAMFGEMEEFGGVFDWSDEANKTFGDLAVSATEAREALRKISGNEDLEIKLDVSDIENTQGKLDALDATIAEMDGIKTKPEVDPSEIEYANEVIRYCVAQKQLLSQPDVMMVDTSVVEGDLGNAIGLLQEFQTAKNNLEVAQALGIDTTQAQANLDAATQKIQDLDTNITSEKALNIDTTSIDTISESLGNLSAELIVKAGVDESAVIGYQEAEHDAQGTVTWNNDTSLVDTYAAANHYSEGTVAWYNDTSLVKTRFYARGYITWEGQQSVNGTAHASGTAYAGGNWGTAPGGKTLVGELGQEIVVDPHTGRWYTVGDYGAEFRDIPRGAIVFNHKQSESLLKNGYVAGRAAALVGGTAMVTGGIGIGNAGDSTVSGGNSTDNYKKPSSSATNSTSNTSTDDEFETFDWIEIAISRIERVIDRLKTTATSTYKALKTKLGATYDEIAMVNQELAIQQQAYDRYMQEANNVVLSSDLAALVQSGAIDISQYDEDTQKLIEDYQKFYEQALECSDAVQQLHENLGELYENNFNDVAADYENQLSLFEHMTNSYNTGLQALEAQGYLQGTEYYSTLQDVERQKISVLNAELAALEQSFSEAMASGEIEKYSDAWYEMQGSINDVKEQIDEANLSLLEYEKTMREIEWDHFDYIQDRISQITDEADFMIELLSNSDLHTDKGQLTDEGMATMGLHAQNYNTHMAQADQYAAEILELNKQIAEDPNNTELIERREELLGLQQDSIIAAENEKQAMIDLVREGIELELDAMQELIDAYTDALDSAKDLYDYQRKIKDHTTEIANIQKQLSAYENDFSEETRAKVQQLSVQLEEAESDLEETEYQQYISDQKKLLDELYLEYETVLNQRLDNTDALLEEMIGSVNSNTDSINSTLTEAADNVGYTMSESMQSIWNGSTEALDGTLSVYGDGFNEKLTAINNVLSQIQANTAAMIANSDDIAEEDISTTNPETEPTPSTGSPETTPTEPVVDTPVEPAEKEITIGGKINAKGAKIYDYAGDNSGENQYFSKDPIYTVLGESNGYLKVRHHKLSSGVTGWFKKSDVKAYKTGGLVDYTGLAQLDGTPTKPELVLNARDTENFLALKETLKRMTQQELSLGTSYGSDYVQQLSGITDISKKIAAIRDGNGVNTGVTVGDIEINIPIEHVDDYNDFVSQLQKDKQFERFVQSMTVDRLVGGGSLKKNKYFGNR